MDATTYIMLHILCEFLHTVPAAQITWKQLDSDSCASVGLSWHKSGETTKLLDDRPMT